MYVDHTAFDKPEKPQSKIWRYMSFTKFMSLIEKRALYFSSIDNLNDPFEGSITRVDMDSRKKGMIRAAEIWKGMNVEYDATEHEEMFSCVNKEERRIFFVNCWHINEYESSAMWDIYSKKDQSIAIQSTFERLCDSFKKYDRIIWIGKVKYIDYDNESIPTDNYLKKFLCKRKSFEHEAELRAIIQPLDPGLKIPYLWLDAIRKITELQGVSTKGIYVDIELEKMIENIYLSPLAEEWYLELIESILEKYALIIPIKKSSISDKSPLF